MLISWLLRTSTLALLKFVALRKIVLEENENLKVSIIFK